MKLEIGKRYTTKSGAITANPESCMDCDSLAKYGCNDGPCERHREAEHDRAAEELAHTRIRQLESLLAEAGARDARNIGLVHDLESRIAQLESQIDDWSRDHAKLNDDLDDMTAVYDEQQSRIASLEQQLADSETRSAKLESALAFIVNEAELLLIDIGTGGIVARLEDAIAEANSILDGAEADERRAFELADDSISSWLHKLPSGYRELALANYMSKECGRNNDKHKPLSIGGLWEAVYFAFSWRRTPEGYGFWQQVYDWLDGKCPLPEIP